MTAQAIFVTGTDTGIGKTVVSGHLVRQLRQTGLDAAYWKPVETGVQPGRSDDVATVVAIAGSDTPATCSLTLAQPAAPLAAAEAAGIVIDPAQLDVDFERLSKMYNTLVVEGAGGLMVPLTANLTWLDMIDRWKMRVLMVVGNRLGCLNHALLTAATLSAHGHQLGGWIMNEPEPTQSYAESTNIEMLSRRLGPPLAAIGYQQAEHANLLGL